jgi:UDP-N-acetylmuramoylalanine--D-glutamate ligase
MTIRDLSYKRVALWGYGRDTAAFLSALEQTAPTARVTVIGDEELPGTSADGLRARGHAVTTGQPGRFIEASAFDVIVRSPGVSVYRPEILQAKRSGTVVTTTTNIFFADATRSRTIIGVTGTKGKSTTASMIAHLLRGVGMNALCCGNIGVPLFDASVEGADVLVVELSSYQLADFTGRLNVAVLLNLYPEHLDWHGGEEAYFRDKKRIFAAQDAMDVSILPGELHAEGKRLAASRRVMYFETRDAYHALDDGIYYSGEMVLSRDDLQLVGRHNLRNAAAALTVLRAMNHLDSKDAVNSLRSFLPLPHRLQTVATLGGVTYINDSISTIPEAALAAIESVGPRPITLIVGGADRGLDWSAFARHLAAQPLHAVVALRDTGYTIAKAIEELQQSGGVKHVYAILRASTLEEAVALAAEITPAGGVVLLSPAAPSYNTYRNFEERGGAFINAIALGTADGQSRLP